MNGYNLRLSVFDASGFLREVSISPKQAARKHPEAFRSLLAEMQKLVGPEQLDLFTQPKKGQA